MKIHEQQPNPLLDDPHGMECKKCGKLLHKYRAYTTTWGDSHGYPCDVCKWEQDENLPLISYYSEYACKKEEKKEMSEEELFDEFAKDAQDFFNETK